MGNTCTCEKSKETNLQELIDKEKLIQEEMKRKEAEEKISKCFKAILYKKQRKMIQYFISEKVKNFIFPSDGREKFRNRKYYDDIMKENIDYFIEVYPKDKCEYKDFLVRYFDFNYSYELVKKYLMKRIINDDYNFYKSFSANARPKSPKRKSNESRNIASPLRSSLRGSFRRQNSTKKKKRTIKGNKPIITLLSTNTSTSGTSYSRKNTNHNNNGTEKAKEGTVDFTDSKINEEFDKLLNLCLSENPSTHDSYLFSVFEHPEKIKPMTIPKYIYKLVKTFYSIYYYKKSNWITNTKSEIKKYLKKPLKKCLDFRLKDNERHSAKAAKFAAENLSIKTIQKKQTLSLMTQANDMYNGEYDILSSLYHGKGILIKDSSNYYYEGTFRNGQKSGVGLYIKVITDNSFIYYRGEFAHNHFNGFGYKAYKDEVVCKFLIGTFKKGKIIYGEEQVYYLKSVKPMYTKYKGAFDDNEQYDGENQLFKRTTFKVNKNNTLSIESLYEYNGTFSNGKQNGYGELKEDLISENYSYTYKGNFENGVKEGYGEIIFSDNFFVKSYEGFFSNDNKFALYGKVSFKSGDVYEGFFDEEHYKSDLGIYFHYDSVLEKVCDNFFGFFFKDKKHGPGRFIAPRERKSLIGDYDNGEKSGVFELNSYGINQLNKKYLFNFGQERTDNERKEIEENENIEKIKKDYSNIKRSKMFFLMEHNDIIDKADTKDNLIV